LTLLMPAPEFPFRIGFKMSHGGAWPHPIGASPFGGLLSLFRGVWLTLGSLALFLTSSGAQVDLDQGKTPAQLYASGCATCHKSPQSVAKTNSIFGLESFLSEHYTTSRESAALLAAYLKGLEKFSMESKRGRAAARSGRTNLSEPAPNVFNMDQPPRPPKDIPNQ
jgi:hypothetical protein